MLFIILIVSISTNISALYKARHSWATLANCKNFQHELIRDAMGHSSVKVTETYFKCHTDEQIDEMNKELLNMLFLSDRRKES